MEQKKSAKQVAFEVMLKSDLKDIKKSIKQSKWIYGIVATIGVLNIYTVIKELGKFNDTIIELMMPMIYGMIAVFAVIAILFIWLIFYVDKKPKQASLISGIVIVLAYIALILISPETFFNGIIFKAFVIFGIGYTYFSIQKAEKLKKKIEEMQSQATES